MSDFHGFTLEDFLEDQCGMVTPKLLELFEPHRDFIEKALEQFHDAECSWRDFAYSLWHWLPEPTEEHFKP